MNDAFKDLGNKQEKFNEKTHGLWNEVIDTRSNRSSYQEHELKTVWESCPKAECYFELTDSPKRECTCNKCGAIAHFVLGMQALKDGKIINLR
jgi:hypothetical protein